jgi:hypothetical protein
VPTLKDLEKDQPKYDKKFFQTENEVLLLAIQLGSVEYAELDKKHRKLKRRAPFQVAMSYWIYLAEQKLAEEKAEQAKQRRRKRY